jgi:hypothetical protein
MLTSSLRSSSSGCLRSILGILVKLLGFGSILLPFGSLFRSKLGNGKVGVQHAMTEARILLLKLIESSYDLGRADNFDELQRDTDVARITTADNDDEVVDDASENVGQEEVGVVMGICSHDEQDNPGSCQHDSNYSGDLGGGLINVGLTGC